MVVGERLLTPIWTFGRKALHWYRNGFTSMLFVSLRCFFSEVMASYLIA